MTAIPTIIQMREHCPGSIDQGGAFGSGGPLEALSTVTCLS